MANRKPDTRRGAAMAAALVAACGAGATAEYFFDRRHGAGRRHQARDRARGIMRRRRRDALRRAKYLEGVASGAAHKATHALPGMAAHKEEPDDVTLAQRVESEAFRKARVPKAHVSVNAENAVVFLRGEVDRPDQIEALVRATQAVEGVRRVTNLLHARAGATNGA
jgi:osmotically-inducible protein OsmY